MSFYFVTLIIYERSFFIHSYVHDRRFEFLRVNDHRVITGRPPLNNHANQASALSNKLNLADDLLFRSNVERGLSARLFFFFVQFFLFFFFFFVSFFRLQFWLHCRLPSPFFLTVADESFAPKKTRCHFIL